MTASGNGNSTDEIRKRIEPTLNKVAIDGLRAWLRSIDLPSGAYSRPAITELVAKHIASKKLDEGALEVALVACRGEFVTTNAVFGV